ncbi:energy-coupling factor ABC transporter permease [Rheinheimera sp.]|uniref:energy-coupling factor ABC transporter permease n=1 Tax=Rheinheimera sp. TaxID=1869214 RepID=UPI003AF90642
MLLLTALTLLAGVLLWLDKAFWAELKQTNAPWSVYGASCCVLALLWQTDAEVLAPLSVHFLGLTTVLLLFGLRLASLLAALVCALGYWQSGWSLEHSLWLLCCAFWTLWLNSLVVWLVYLYLPRHLFIYVFVAAFLNSALALCVFLLLKALPFWQDYSSLQLTESYLIFIPLAALPEALLNGMAMTLLVVYKPQWVKTFSQRQYLDPN